METHSFSILVYILFAVWIIGTALFYIPNKKTLNLIGTFGIFAGILILIGYVTNLWIYLGRPPIKTLGETRLWYALFLSIIGLITYYRWRVKWFVAYSVGMSLVFLTIDLMNPSAFDQTLMPALQSYWFVPHVIVYILSYSLLAFAALIAARGVYDLYKNKYDEKTLILADNIVYIGFAFLTFGLLFGALWAKEAWGNYWTWDPKETWAFITWMCYMLYIHLRYQHPKATKLPLILLAFSFVILLICWFGINYLPAAQNSVHVYAS